MSERDRFTMDVLREAFFAVTDEMFVSLQQTSQSPVIYEVLDFAVGLTDAHGELVSQGNGIAGFLYLPTLEQASALKILRAAATRPKYTLSSRASAPRTIARS